MAKEKKSKFMQPMQLSEELTAIVGRGPMPRTEVTKKLWAYIKKNRLQDPNKDYLHRPRSTQQWLRYPTHETHE